MKNEIYGKDKWLPFVYRRAADSPILCGAHHLEMRHSYGRFGWFWACPEYRTGWWLDHGKPRCPTFNDEQLEAYGDQIEIRTNLV